MRSVSTRARGARLLLPLLLALAASTVLADDPNPNEPPELRSKPPIGVSSDLRGAPPIGAPSDLRISPPGGAPETNLRIKPPGGVTPEPTALELLMGWLRANLRTLPPIG